MRPGTHKREVERDHESTNEDFATAGPWELVTLVLVTSAYSFLFVSVPRLLSQVYGDLSTRALRPTILVLTLGFVFANRTAARETSTPIVLLGLTVSSWALFLKHAPTYFARDVSYIDAVLEGIVSVMARLAAKGHVSADRVPSDPSSWSPVIASSVVETWLFGSLTVVLVSMLRQRARKTQLPVLVPMMALLAYALVACKVIDSYGLAEASDIFRVIPMLGLLCVVMSRNMKSLASSILCCMFISWALQSTTTFSCSKLPQILHCRDKVGDFDVRATSESSTGRITVLENARYRLLKADHSLLGGEWLAAGQGQSIFSAFYMQALALYALPTPKRVVDVLQIGLGIGTATKSLLELSRLHDCAGNMSIDVLELDPKVVDYAHDYFDLPRPEVEPRLTVHKLDAVQYVGTAEDAKYDLISHDVFSGGGLSFPLFTQQFFRRLKRALKADGILTVNVVYAPATARLNMDAVIATLKSVFSEVELYIETGKVEQINNVVLFCSDAEVTLSIPPGVARLPGTLGRTAREMEQWSFTPSSPSSPSSSSSSSSGVYDNATLILQDVSADNGESRHLLRGGERRMASAHWRLMRHLLPPPEDEIWTAF